MPPRNKRPTLLSLGLSLGLTLGAASAWAGAGEGIRVGRVSILPYAQVGGTYDSNVFLDETNVQADLFWRFRLGLDLQMPGDDLALDIAGALETRSYMDTDPAGNNQLTGRLGGRLALGRREKLQFLLVPSYEQAEDYSINLQPVDLLATEAQAKPGQAQLATEDRTDRNRRDMLRTALGLGRTFSKTTMDLRYNFSSVNYVDAYQFDSAEQWVGAEGGYRITDKSALFAEYRYGIQESDGFESNSSYQILRGGLRGRVTDKTSFKAGVGVERYDGGTADLMPATASGSTPGGTATNTDAADGADAVQSLFSYDVAGYWQATPKIRVQFSLGNSIDPSSYEAGSTRQTSLAALGTRYRMSHGVSWSADLSARTDDYHRPILETDAQQQQREVAAYGFRIAMDYAPPARFYSLHLEGSHESSDSNIEDESYAQTRASLNVKIKY